MYLAISWFVVILGLFFTYITWLFPVPAGRFGVPWFAAMLFMTAPLIMTVRLHTSKAKYLFDPPPKGNRRLIFFIHRDLTGEFKYGKRIRETSFIDVPDLGIIHDLGKGCVVRVGDKFIRMCIENVAFPLPPHYINFFERLQKAGFTDLEEVYAFINGTLDEKRMTQLRENLMKIKSRLEGEVRDLKIKFEDAVSRTASPSSNRKKENSIDEIRKRIDELKVRRRGRKRGGGK